MSGTSLGARFLSHRPSIDAASRRLAFAVIALALTLASSAASAQDAPATVTADECRDVVARLGRSLDERYVFPDKGAACRAMLDELLASGGLEGISAPDEFARVLTDKLQDLTHDKHLRVRFRPPGAGRTEGPRENPALARARQLMQARAQNYAFVKTEILEGNIGYLDLRGFAPPFPAARETAAAAMNFLANCDAVIFDLRRNGGGSPGMIRFVTSWLFEKPTHLNSLYWREGDRTEEFWTQAEIPGRRLADVPAFVLTSNFTFSGGEEFTYNLQCLKRATIIGETTGGGAHPGGTVPVGERFMAFIPAGRAINPITGANWEGAGVVPDIQVAADDALDTALPLAREAAEKRRQTVMAKIEDLWRRFESALSAAPALIAEGKSAQAESALHAALTEGLEAGFVGEEDINVLGYEQLNGDHVETAILVFKFNAGRFPESANVYDSLGEAYMKAGRNEQAIESYRRALAIDPELPSAREALRALGAGG